MSDSVRRKDEDNTKEAIAARMAKYKAKTMQERVDPATDIPAWAQVAIVKKELYGISYKDALAQLGIKRSPARLSQYAQSPAGHRLRETISDFRTDPVAVASAMLRGNALNVTLDRLAFLEMAKEVGNYTEGDKIARDIMDRIPGLEKKSNQRGGSMSAMQITVNLGSGTATLEPATGESSYEVKEAEFDVE